jgi:hypothetical protein
MVKVPRDRALGASVNSVFVSADPRRPALAAHDLASPPSRDHSASYPNIYQEPCHPMDAHKRLENQQFAGCGPALLPATALLHCQHGGMTAKLA